MINEEFVSRIYKKFLQLKNRKIIAAPENTKIKM